MSGDAKYESTGAPNFMPHFASQEFLSLIPV